MQTYDKIKVNAVTAIRKNLEDSKFLISDSDLKEFGRSSTEDMGNAQKNNSQTITQKHKLQMNNHVSNISKYYTNKKI